MTKSCIKRVKGDRDKVRGKERDRKRSKGESKNGRILKKEKVIIRELKNCLMKSCDKKVYKQSEKRQRGREREIGTGGSEKVSTGEYGRKRKLELDRNRTA
jgi:hypothetical protein